MMGVVHSALRRDLVRARVVLDGQPPLANPGRSALAEHLLWLMAFLHDHHSNEDAGLYPMVLRNDPSTATLVADMNADHLRIDPAMAALRSAAESLRDDPAAAAAVTEALSGLDHVLIPHLSREETVMMPVVARCVTQRELKAWDDEMNVGDKSMRQLAMEGHWLLDDLDPSGRALVVALVPAVQRFVLLHFLGGPYQRRRDLLWRNGPAEQVPSLSIEAYVAYQR
jgi:iron-sulfur cluster repair protein YtfE (RIC family)